jgi:hypothetical protein
MGGWSGEVRWGIERGCCLGRDGGGLLAVYALCLGWAMAFCFVCLPIPCLLAFWTSQTQRVRSPSHTP